MPRNLPPRISKGAKFHRARRFAHHFARNGVEDTLHRTLVQRIVAGNFTGEILSGQNSGEVAESWCRISGVERAPTAFQAAQTVAGDANQIFFRPSHPRRGTSCRLEWNGNPRASAKLVSSVVPSAMPANIA